MPTEEDSPALPSLSRGEFVTIRRTLLAMSLRMMEPVLLGKVEPTLDDAITTFMLVSIGPSENNLGEQLPQWLNFNKFVVKTLNLSVEPECLDDEEREERRRYVRLSGSWKFTDLQQRLVGDVYYRPAFFFLVQPSSSLHRYGMPKSEAAMFG